MRTANILYLPPLKAMLHVWGVRCSSFRAWYFLARFQYWLLLFQSSIFKMDSNRKQGEVSFSGTTGRLTTPGDSGFLHLVTFRFVECWDCSICSMTSPDLAVLGLSFWISWLFGNSRPQTTPVQGPTEASGLEFWGRVHRCWQGWAYRHAWLQLWQLPFVTSLHNVLSLHQHLTSAESSAVTSCFSFSRIKGIW